MIIAEYKIYFNKEWSWLFTLLLLAMSQTIFLEENDKSYQILYLWRGPDVFHQSLRYLINFLIWERYTLLGGNVMFEK